MLCCAIHSTLILLDLNLRPHIFIGMKLYVLATGCTYYTSVYLGTNQALDVVILTQITWNWLLKDFGNKDWPVSFGQFLLFVVCIITSKTYMRWLEYFYADFWMTICMKNSYYCHFKLFSVLLKTKAKCLLQEIKILGLVIGL